MLSKEDNDTLCHVGPGTVMGDLIRQYWLPAMRSEELAGPDSPPLRIRLLGENLIGFRDTTGKVGLVANACPHRGASLFFGRNEEEGLRCVYHGWKFDIDGNCTDMPSEPVEPVESNFKNKVRVLAYPCAERGGIIWTYMGPRQDAPPLPVLEPNMLPDGNYTVDTTFRECNWLQAIEGDIDTAHLNFLHNGSITPEDTAPRSYNYYMAKERSPRYVVMDTDFGTSYGTYRPAEADTTYWRIAHFLMPGYSMIPTGVLGDQIMVRRWVPVDDEHSMLWMIHAGVRARAAGPGQAPFTVNSAGGNTQQEYVPNTSGWYGRFRSTQHAGNDYLIDRGAQSRNENYTGIPGIQVQDQAITESMGPIYNRLQEHLATTDSMIIRTRRRLLGAAKALREIGAVPPGVDDPQVYATRSGGIILPNDADWLDTTVGLRVAFAKHEGLSEEPFRIAEDALSPAPSAAS